MTNEYAAALEAHNAAQIVFAAARDKFFAIPGIATKADFAEFAAAQNAMKLADRAFDVAFEAEANLPEEVVVEVAADDGQQIDMFEAVETHHRYGGTILGVGIPGWAR